MLNISRPFILRPVATTLLTLAMVVVGLVAMRFLPVSSLPSVDYPTVQVQTFYPGASPDVMSTTVTAPLEVQLGQIPGLHQMTSNSSAGASRSEEHTPELQSQSNLACRLLLQNTTGSYSNLCTRPDSNLRTALRSRSLCP